MKNWYKITDIHGSVFLVEGLNPTDAAIVHYGMQKLDGETCVFPVRVVTPDKRAFEVDPFNSIERKIV